MKKLLISILTILCLCTSTTLARDAGDGEHDKDPIDPTTANKELLPIDYGISTMNDDYRNHMRMQLHSSAATLRTTPMGTRITIIPNGSTFEINYFMKDMQSDGYRWVNAYYYMNNTNVNGYAQYDPVVMYPYGHYDTGGYTNMRLDSSAARIRSSIMGNVLTVAPAGADIKTTRFTVELQSDGYRWNEGEYGGYKGFYQYDPEVMYPWDR